MMPKLMSLSCGLLILLLLEFYNLRVLKVCSVQDYSRDDFPADFVFGSGTSAYQVEGAPFEDGKTPSTWDTFTHGGYVHGATGDIACDGYHKYKEDVQLMADTGLEAYRFSISWPRLIPNGRGPVNPKGLQFYNNFINELISHGIQPHATLYHGDLPQSLEDEYGGWLSKNIVKDFVAYTEVCFREFGDRVRHWTTFNEINMLPLLGYDAGIMPPGRCSFFYGMNCTIGNSLDEPYKVAHNSLLAHASAARLYQKKYKGTQYGFIGLNVLAFWFIPYSNSTEDVLATQRAHEFYVGWFVNPLVNGDYPEVVKKNAGTKIPAFTKMESIRLKGSLDFLGVNHYATTYIKDKSSSLETDKRDVMGDMGVDVIVHGSGMELYQGLKELLEYLKEIYDNPPIYIHENGLRTRRNGTMNELNDTPRVRYMHGFIGSMLDAIRNGTNARGYFTWSFLDVFELMGGYDSAYGLHYVDLNDKDLKRYPKSSARWYSDFLKGGGIGLEDKKITEVGANNIFEFSHSHFYH